MIDPVDRTPPPSRRRTRRPDVMTYQVRVDPAGTTPPAWRGWRLRLTCFWTTCTRSSRQPSAGPTAICTDSAVALPITVMTPPVGAVRKCAEAGFAPALVQQVARQESCRRPALFPAVGRAGMLDAVVGVVGVAGETVDQLPHLRWRAHRRNGSLSGGRAHLVEEEAWRRADGPAGQR